MIAKLQTSAGLLTDLAVICQQLSGALLCSFKQEWIIPSLLLPHNEIGFSFPGLRSYTDIQLPESALPLSVFI